LIRLIWALVLLNSLFPQIHPRSTHYPPGKIRFLFIVFQNFTGNLGNMKKLLFLLLAFGAMQARAQVVKGSIDLKDSTFTRSIPFEVAAGTQSVKYFVKVYVSVGAVTVSLTDPNDKKVTGFTIGTSKPGGGHEASKGEMGDDVKPKVFGTWKFNIKAENATGKISYQVEEIKP